MPNDLVVIGKLILFTEPNNIVITVVIVAIEAIIYKFW